MNSTPRPHDLLWLADSSALEGFTEPWVAAQWRPALPVVVRRDAARIGRIPVLIRGMRHQQLAAGWVNASRIIRTVMPESLTDTRRLLCSPFVSQPPVQGAIQLAMQIWPWTWGITGDVGYSLATEIPLLHATGELNLLIRAPLAHSREAFRPWLSRVNQLPCRTATQVETPYGGFALAEWLQEGRVLLKTHYGTRLVSDPWHIPGE
ncbi:malonate decarboxylase holo-ACP synthase [Entomohabitans teleogrylli]|uniref:malonate decarboxylase holo-ACP synthase n=1 Tax=Entomohabitans teleogrylli TaxID=1384589 RepID=UPI00073D6BBB|nr:malonate decarboxylase holo-ACP synthase [Entomohabitans teleogrylli]